jgi:hypothetical protein
MHLVLVHLGNAPASHLWLNIKRTQRMFPELPITLIYSDESFLNHRNVSGLLLYKYQIRSDATSPLGRLSHNIEFRKGFWRYSIERIYALADWHNNNPLEVLIHLESDILLLSNFPFQEISKKEKLAWCRFNQTHDVASIFFSPRADETKWLAEELDIVLEKNNELTDMTSLRVIHQSYPTRISYINGEESDTCEAGYFDAAPFGMWLTGRDPRNYFGFVRRFMALPESDISPEKYRFSFHKGGRISITDASKVTRYLFNLHVHSKSSLLFGKFWQIHLAFLVATSRIGFPKTVFSPKAFIKIVIDFRRRHVEKSLAQQILKVIYRK